MRNFLSTKIVILVAVLSIFFSFAESVLAAAADATTAYNWWLGTTGAVSRYAPGPINLGLWANTSSLPTSITRSTVNAAGTVYITDTVTVDTSGLGTHGNGAIGFFPYDLVCISPVYEGNIQSNLYIASASGYLFFTDPAQCQTGVGSKTFTFFRNLPPGTSYNNAYAIYVGSDLANSPHGLPTTFAGGSVYLDLPNDVKQAVDSGAAVTPFPGPPYAVISPSTIYTPPNTSVNVLYTTNPLLGPSGSSFSDSCVASNDQGLSSWTGAIITANTTSYSKTVGPVSAQTNLTLSCTNAQGTYNAAATIIPQNPDFVLSFGNNSALPQYFLINKLLTTSMNFTSCTRSSSPAVSQWDLAGGSPANPASQVSIGPLTPGTYTFTLACSRGSTVVTKQITGSITSNRAPGIPSINGPTSGPPGSYSFDVSSVDPDGDMLAFGKSNYSTWRLPGIPFSTTGLNAIFSALTPTFDVPSGQHVYRTVDLSSFVPPQSLLIGVGVRDVWGAQNFNVLTFNLTNSSQNGVCGTANAFAQYAKPGSTPPTLCSSTGSIPVVAGNGLNENWSWTCTGSNGGSNASCSAPLAGTCGSATTQPSSSAPSLNLCSLGTASPSTPVVNGSNWQWTCLGTAPSNVNSTCTVPVIAAQDGTCNAATNNKKIVALPNEAARCSVGVSTNFQTTATGWRWKCDNSANGGGVSIMCNATRLQVDVNEK